MSISYRLSGEGYSRVEQARKKKGWRAQDIRWRAEANVSLSTLKRFREHRVGIHESCFSALCRAIGIDDWEAQAEQTGAEKIDDELLLSAYESGVWVGREHLIPPLIKKLKEGCRLLAVTGITGIGKTAFAERLLIELKNIGILKGNLIRENLDDYDKDIDFVSFATRLLEKLEDSPEPSDQTDPQMLLARIVQHLRRTSHFIVVDSLERLLRGNKGENHGEFDDEWYARFFRAILSADDFKSCFILTSQDLPGQVQEAAHRYKNFWHYEALSGLTKEAQLNLFEKVFEKADFSLEKYYENKAKLERIGKAYEGHPLALRTIAGEIVSKPFNGNTSAYWHKYGHEIEEVEKAISEAQLGHTTGSGDCWQLDRFTQTLRRSVRNRIEHTLARLKQDCYWSYILLCEASIYRLPVLESWWLKHLDFWPASKMDKSMAVDVLRDRYLLEEVIHDDQYMVRLHNLIRSVALEHLHGLGE